MDRQVGRWDARPSNNRFGLQKLSHTFIIRIYETSRVRLWGPCVQYSFFAAAVRLSTGRVSTNARVQTQEGGGEGGGGGGGVGGGGGGGAEEGRRMTRHAVYYLWVSKKKHGISIRWSYAMRAPWVDKGRFDPVSAVPPNARTNNGATTPVDENFIPSLSFISSAIPPVPVGFYSNFFFP